MPEAKTFKLMIPYLYIQGYDETQKILEKFRTKIYLGIDGQHDYDGTDNNKEEDGFINSHNTMNNETAILATGASNNNDNILGFVGRKTREKIPHNGKANNSRSYHTIIKSSEPSKEASMENPEVEERNVIKPRSEEVDCI